MSRTRRTCRLLGLLVVTIYMVGCAAYGSDLTDEEFAAQGLIELDRISGSVFAAEIHIDEWTTVGTRHETSAHANNDPGPLFGSVGRYPTSLSWTYTLEPGVELSRAFDAAVSELERLGARLESEFPDRRRLEVSTEHDKLVIRLTLIETGEIRHSVVRIGDD